MKTLYLSILLLVCLPQNSLAQKIEFKFNQIPQKNINFSGTLPLITTFGFESVNEKILIDLLLDGTRTHFTSTKKYQSSNHIVFHVHLEIEGARSYTREKYYVIDLDSKKLLSLSDILKLYNIVPQDIESEISKKLSDCQIQSLLSISLDYCEDAGIEVLLNYFADDNRFIQLKNTNNFYLRDQIIGIVYDVGLYSVPFEYNIKSQSIQ